VSPDLSTEADVIRFAYKAPRRVPFPLSLCGIGLRRSGTGVLTCRELRFQRPLGCQPFSAQKLPCPCAMVYNERRCITPHLRRNAYK